MKIVIFGIESMAEMLYYYLTEDSHQSVYAFTVNEQYIKSSSHLPKSVIPYEELKNCAEEYLIVNSVGYYDMNDRRRLIDRQLAMDGFRVIDYIHPSATIAKNIDIVPNGGNIFLENVIIQPFCKIGKGNVFHAGVCIAHHSAIGDFNWFAPCTTTGGNVHIGNNCFFGCNSTVKSNVKVSDYTLVGAGAYCSMNSLPNQVIKPPRSEFLSDLHYSKF